MFWNGVFGIFLAEALIVSIYWFFVAYRSSDMNEINWIE